MGDAAASSLGRNVVDAAGGRYTIGVDIGGTFTDVVVVGDDGRVHHAKAPTTPDDFSLGVIDAIGAAAEGLGIDRVELLGTTDLVKHGSTVATNALITRKGVTVGLITTRGFEDTPSIMRAVGRVDGLPAEEIRRVTMITKPAPLVPPELVRGVSERIDASGAIVVALEADDVRAAATDLVERHGCEALAISFLHAWRNPVHERQARAVIEELYPSRTVFCSLGSDLSLVAGEYARTNTAIADAFVGPPVRRYLDSLERQLRSDGFDGQILVMKGNGGLSSHAGASPISTLQSGPAGGMLATAYMTDRLDHRRVITADMGGTSFDVGIIDGGYWRYADEPVFERFRILQPIVDITSIGAGGGTIARVDESTGRLLVGPESAGARPGPVCYGQGGDQPTVTDCDLILGYLDPEYFLGGRRPLDPGSAYAALEQRLARPLGMTVEEAAAGVVRIVNSKMSDLIRREVIRSGGVPTDFTLYAFGGASPAHAVGYARDLGVPQIVIFPTSPVFSAFGIAVADIVHTRLATRSYALPTDPEVLNADLESLEGELGQQLQGTSTGAPVFRRYVTMQFRRQTSGEELALPWDRFTPDRVDELVRLFVAHYERLYGEGVAYTDAGVDISGLRVDAVVAVSKPELPAFAGGGTDPRSAVKGHREAWFDGGLTRTPIYDYDRLAPDMALDGPAIVESASTTAVIPPRAALCVDRYRNLVVRP